jgi:hypothetical protein
VCDSSFARAILTVTTELITRLGAKWHGAHNNDVMSDAMIVSDMNGLAASYDDLTAGDRKAEIVAVTSMLRSGQHATRQHSERTAHLVRERFDQTPPDNAALRDVELNVFGDKLGSKTGSPSQIRRSIQYLSPCTECTPVVLFETEAEHEPVLHQGGLSEQKKFMNLLGIFHCFLCDVTLNDMLPVGAANLFHFKRESRDQAQYSIKQDQHCTKSLIFPKEDLTASCYLNDFFFNVFSKFSDWQNMKSMAVSSL